MREDTQKAINEYNISTRNAFRGDVESIEAAEKFLSEDENVLFVSPTLFSRMYKDVAKRAFSHAGIIFLTDKRVFLYYTLAKEPQPNSFPLENIGNVSYYANPLTGNLVLSAVQFEDRFYNFTIEIGSKFSLTTSSVNKKMLAKVAETFEYARDTYSSGKPTERTAISENKEENPSSDILLQIEKLSELKEKGILTEDEFQAKKSELLARL